MEQIIEHTGVVERVVGEQVFVRIEGQGCDACAAHGRCAAMGDRRQLVVTSPVEHFRTDDIVRVVGRSSMGLRAVLWAFVLPLAGMVAAIISASALHLGEAEMAAVGITFLTIYYLILYALRAKLGRRFVFTLHRAPLFLFVTFYSINPISLLLCC